MHTQLFQNTQLYAEDTFHISVLSIVITIIFNQQSLNVNIVIQCSYFFNYGYSQSVFETNGIFSNSLMSEDHPVTIVNAPFFLNMSHICQCTVACPGHSQWKVHHLLSRKMSHSVLVTYPEKVQAGWDGTYFGSTCRSCIWYQNQYASF